MKSQTVHLVVGVPASGKSFCCEKLRDKYAYAPHDARLGHANHPEQYVKEIMDLVHGDKPVLAETPFSISEIKGRLEAKGVEVKPVFIVAKEDDLVKRWNERGNVVDKTRRGHLSRQATYMQRARESGSFMGSSSEVMEYLRSKA